MVCEVLASIELGTHTNPGLQFIPLPEILAKAPDSTRMAPHPLRIPISGAAGGYLVPDAVFGLEYVIDGRKMYRFFALEADRGTMPVIRSSPEQSSYRRKLLAYREIIARQVYRSHLGVDASEYEFEMPGSPTGKFSILEMIRMLRNNLAHVVNSP